MHQLNKFIRHCLCTNKRYESQCIEKTYDICIIGGGIVGLAVAKKLKLKYSKKNIILLEKENELATAQTGHNSGVIHAGMYYKSGSLKAKLCVEGSDLIYQYCDEKKIPYQKVGKLIVAVNENEINMLKEIYNRALQNNVKDIKYIDSNKKIREIEPYCKGIHAVHCKHTGIVDWKNVAKNFGMDFTNNGGEIQLNFEVDNIEYHTSKNSKYSINDTYIKNNDEKNNADNNNQEEIILISNKKNNLQIKCKKLITCTGIYSDRISQLTSKKNLQNMENKHKNENKNKTFKMIPFRGEYLLLSKQKKHFISGNIYPVPDLNMPFLGVHFTPTLHGDVLIGPNAILAFSREGYKFTDFNFKDFMEQFSFVGLYKLLFKNYKLSTSEIYKSFNIYKQHEEISKMVDNITVEDLQKNGPSGVRAQGLFSDGSLMEDFVFDETQKNIFHVINAPSPAATSSLAIAKIVVDKIEKHFF